MSVWQRVTPQNKCPICQRDNWCQFGDKAMKCMRVESPHPCDSGGWYHFYQTKQKPDFVPRPGPPTRFINAESIMMGWRRTTQDVEIYELAAKLDVTMMSLVQLEIAWAKEHDAFAFPMKDGEGKTIGIRLRNHLGFKWAVRGSQQGIFIPDCEPQQIAFLPEGPTDTAACLSLGLYAIGRPSCLTGGEQIKTTLNRNGVHRIVIVADNDELKHVGNSEVRPGIQGARRLKKFLGLPSVIWQPPMPVKDVREFLQKGGTRQMIESDIRNRLWTKN